MARRKRPRNKSVKSPAGDVLLFAFTSFLYVCGKNVTKEGVGPTQPLRERSRKEIKMAFFS